MDRETYLKFHETICNNARALSANKSKDYAKDADVFHNFEQCEALGICSVEQGFLVRLSDKFSRIANLLTRTEGAAVKDETVQDTLLDVINYTSLLAAYLSERKES